VSDLIAGRPAGREGGGGPWNDGAPPPVLMAALGAATLIAVTLVAMFGGFGGGDDPDQAGLGADARSAAGVGQRAQLTVSFEGSGDGEIKIRPGDISCRQSCEHDFPTGTRVTVTFDAASGSTFEGWGDSCDGQERCAIFMDGARSLSATFESKPAEPVAPAEPPCDDAASAGDPACADEDLDAPADEDLDAPDDAPPPVNDCADGRDNDRDGLTDRAQDPDCVGGRTETG
jgi:List-Bact-rpt repeat protein